MDTKGTKGDKSMERPEFQLCFKDYCDGCPNMQIRHDMIYGDGIPLIVTISCEHMQTCQNIEKMRLIDADILRKDVLDGQPTVDAEPTRHGHWRADETVYTTGEVWCSVCRTLYYIGDLYDVGGGNNLPNYCPHCGAKMGEEDRP